MPIAYRWDETDPHIIHSEFSSPWTWNEFFDVIREQIQMMKDAERDHYYIISDFRASRGLPVGPGVTNVASAYRSYPPELRTVIVISEERFIHIMVNIFQRLYSAYAKRLIACEKLETAYEIIAEHRANTDSQH